MPNNSLSKLIYEEGPSSKSEPFGKYLFGQERNKPNKARPEENTNQERELASQLHNHYHGSPDDLTPSISQLDKLERAGKYTDILTVPSKYKYAYRVMSSVPLKTLTAMIGYQPTDVEDNVIYEENNGGVFTPYKSRPHYSWTVNPKVFQDIQDDWGSFFHTDYGNNFVVFMRAPISSNRFLINPDRTQFSAEGYAYQREILSVGKVQCDHIWFLTGRDETSIMRHVIRYGK